MTTYSHPVAGHPCRLAARVVLAFVGGVVALILLFAAVGGQAPPAAPGSGGVNTAHIPARYVPWVLAAGSLCAAISPAIIAAQIQVESGWTPGVRNAASGAEGIAQFLPTTFPAWGRNDDGTGNVSPLNPYDAIMAQGRYDCSLAALAARLVSFGQAVGSVVDLALAAYNAGPGQVEAAHGVPTDAAAYVRQIESLAATRYSTARASGSGAAQTAVAAAETALGTPYQWAGSCTDPHGANPSGWCDCSSLVQMAWHAAGVDLPRTTFEQVSSGTPVRSVSQLRAGDLIFTPGSDGSAAAPGHVGLYVGGGMLINAPQTGQVVQFATVASWQSQIVSMRHIR